MTDSFEDYAKALLNDAFEGVRADLEGKPFITKFPHIAQAYFNYRCLKDFTYHHSGQDIHHGDHSYTAGEIYSVPKFVVEDPMSMTSDLLRHHADCFEFVEEVLK